MEKNSIEKSSMLYDFIDNSALYFNPVKLEDRSRMNVPFFLRDESLNESFLMAAEQRGLVQLGGHRTVGGMRASLYNAMPIEGVEKLVEFMKEFEANNAK